MSRRSTPSEDHDEVAPREIRPPFRPWKRKLLPAGPDAVVTDETRRALLSAELIKDASTRALFIDTLLGAGRLEEALDEWDHASVERSPAALTEHGDDFLRKGEFALATDYYHAADVEVPRDQYLRHWAQFLSCCRSPDTIVRFCKQVGIEFPKRRLIALADAIVANTETGDLLTLGQAVRAYEAAQATERLVQVADDCRKSLRMTRDETHYVLDIYRSAGASARIVSLARTLGPWANLEDFVEYFTASGESPQSADFVGFGNRNRDRGHFDVAIAAYRRAGATRLLRALAIRIVQGEASHLGQFDLSPAARSLTLEALHAVSEAERLELRAA